MILFLLFVSSVSAQVYGPAMDTASRALMIQTGITQQLDAMMVEANRRLAYFIDSETPIHSKDLYFGVGTIYAVGVRREIVQTFENPFIGGLRHTITFGAITKAFSVQFNF